MNGTTKDGRIFRYTIGIMALLAGIAGFITLFFIEVPPANNNALMFAMGIIFQWGGNVIASEYGASATGRKIADQAVQQMAQAPADAKPAPQSAAAGADEAAEAAARRAAEIAEQVDAPAEEPQS